MARFGEDQRRKVCQAHLLLQDLKMRLSWERVSGCGILFRDAASSAGTSIWGVCELRQATPGGAGCAFRLGLAK
jgi:hypothetical protein